MALCDRKRCAHGQGDAAQPPQREKSEEKKRSAKKINHFVECGIAWLAASEIDTSTTTLTFHTHTNTVRVGLVDACHYTSYYRN